MRCVGIRSAPGGDVFVMNFQGGINNGHPFWWQFYKVPSDPLPIFVDSRTHNLTAAKRAFTGILSQAVVVLSVMLTFAGCAGQGAARVRAAGSADSSGTTSPSSSADAGHSSGASGEGFTLDGAYGSVQVLAGDTQGRGVWAWATQYPTKPMDEAESRVFHYTEADGLQSWPLGHDRGVLAGSVADPSLVTCGSDAWLGINWNLFEVDPTKGIVGRWTIPDVAQDGVLTKRVPPAAQAFTEHTLIRDIACHGDTVSIAIWHGTSSLVFDAVSATFHTVAMPSGATAVSTAVAADKTVAFGLQSVTDTGPDAGPHEVVLYEPDTERTRTVRVGTSVPIQSPPGSSTTQFVTGSGTDVITASANLADVEVSDGTAAPTGSGTDPYRASVAYLPDGRAVVPGADGIHVDATKGHGSELVSLGTRPCGPPDAPHHRGVAADSTRAPGTRCPIGATVVAVDGSGTIWYPGYLGDGSRVPIQWVSAPSG